MNLAKQWSQSIKGRSWHSIDSLSIGNTTHLHNLLLKFIDAPTINTSARHLFFNGFHFLYNNQTNIQLGSDGYDNYQAPCDIQGKQLFTRRMWVKGCITFSPPKTDFDVIACSESISSTRIINDSTFVNIERRFSANDTPILHETRTLIYTNKPYTANKLTKVNLPQPLHSLTLKLSPTDLLKYSCLTYNLHKIHWDKEYCRTVESLPNVIVHGPFMVSLLLYWFNCLNPHSTIKSFQYKNLTPCFVDEALTLTLDQVDNTTFVLSIVNNALNKTYIQGTLVLEPLLRKLP